MSRWTVYFWRAMAALSEGDRTRAYSWAAPDDQIRRERQFDVDLSDQASVDAAFYSIVEREWGAPGFQDGTPALRGQSAGDEDWPQALPHYFWMWFLPW